MIEFYKQGSIILHDCKYPSYPQIRIWMNDYDMWYMDVIAERTLIDQSFEDYLINFCPFCGMDLYKKYKEWRRENG